MKTKETATAKVFACPKCGELHTEDDIKRLSKGLKCKACKKVTGATKWLEVSVDSFREIKTCNTEDTVDIEDAAEALNIWLNAVGSICCKGSEAYIASKGDGTFEVVCSKCGKVIMDGLEGFMGLDMADVVDAAKCHGCKCSKRCSENNCEEPGCVDEDLDSFEDYMFDANGGYAALADKLYAAGCSFDDELAIRHFITGAIIRISKDTLTIMEMTPRFVYNWIVKHIEEEADNEVLTMVLKADATRLMDDIVEVLSDLQESRAEHILQKMDYTPCATEMLEVVNELAAVINEVEDLENEVTDMQAELFAMDSDLIELQKMLANYKAKCNKKKLPFPELV